MKVLHTIGSLSSNSGGPARSVPGLCSELDKCDIVVNLAVQSYNCNVSSDIRALQYIKYSENHTQYDFLESLFLARRYDLIHNHAIWSYASHIVNVFSRKNKIPLVISTRGMLEPWSLNTKKWKKKLAMMLYQRNDIKLAVALHATAESEALQFRKLGFKQSIIISPNGVALPKVMPVKSCRKDSKMVILFHVIHAYTL